MRKSILHIVLGAFLFSNVLIAQELGSNFNHNPEIMDFDYLEKAEVDWVRTTPRIMDYADGTLSIENDPGLSKVVEAGKRGYKVAFGFRWDFAKNDWRIPEPKSKREKELFETATQILEKVGPYVDIFKLGNEPNLETLPIDMVKDENGEIPLVEFTDRLLYKVVLPFFRNQDPENIPDIYIGSFPALFEKRFQENPGVNSLLKYTNDNDDITGLSLHLHIEDTLEIDQSFQYARSIVKDKPIIVPEFSLHRLYRKKITEPLNINEAGEAFARKYGRDPEWKLYQWYGYVNTNRVSPEEWDAMFATREWFPQHYLQIYFDRFEKYGVVLATYPLFQQSCPENMTPNSPAWFINPIFCQKSLELQPDGAFSPNPLCFEDFVTLVKENRNTEN
ncbi:hypothetical protein NE848_02875 [Gramella jeungdoensis]|uniref:Uncharacterized protein n=1 Tax=Gramella jeungdoensis TaxID=708091 RepID=A0ABT0Z0I5_9FLAO|nr:hypothetical protein [Gramella jeungdoensis]MCM8568304.1 hypothetical protein [Gramella jeungdoensis]